MTAHAEALRWAVRRAVEAEDRAERWIGWGRPSERAEEKASHAAAVERVKALRELCDLTRRGTAMTATATTDPDVLLLELADVGVRRLVLECRPSRTRSLYVATWTQEGRKMMREARSVGAVLRRVVRAAGAVSGAPGRKGQAA